MREDVARRRLFCEWAGLATVVDAERRLADMRDCARRCRGWGHCSRGVGSNPASQGLFISRATGEGAWVGRSENLGSFLSHVRLRCISACAEGAGDDREDSFRAGLPYIPKPVPTIEDLDMTSIPDRPLGITKERDRDLSLSFSQPGHVNVDNVVTIFMASDLTRRESGTCFFNRFPNPPPVEGVAVRMSRPFPVRVLLVRIRQPRHVGFLGQPNPARGGRYYGDDFHTQTGWLGLRCVNHLVSIGLGCGFSGVRADGCGSVVAVAGRLQAGHAPRGTKVLNVLTRGRAGQ